ncbi:hypothetical protein [Streptomyces sp. CB03911]|uniref:hypothetical protein n=1 Tax=Streptomyces sp. CB03911 TaxID=1804758 RepID=UPI00093C7D7F|nr:hypothetical protein [Streptomyces sp. CB03911]OKI16572.1 hypothetical protein A6A07_11225 [Streptomyces sp. CB03911]
MSSETMCIGCGHHPDQHEQMPDGTRPCRSIGHPAGVPCAECRRLTEAQHLERIQEMRADDTGAFEAAWASYKVTYDHARQEIGPGWQAYFTDHHQSALASALLAFAHQLAEQQRREMHAPGRSYDASRWNRCVGMTADIIDPEVAK